MGNTVRTSYQGHVHFDDDLQALITENKSRISTIQLDYNDNEDGMSALSDNMAKLKKYVNAPKEVGNYMMQDTGFLFQLVTARSMLTWLEKFEAQLNDIQLIKLLTPEVGDAEKPSNDDGFFDVFKA